jgi:hypothetical protein
MSEYLFHANALGVGGAVTYNGRRTVIPSHAGVVLSAGGGHGSGRSENYDDNGVSFSLAETHVKGSEIAAGIFETITDVRIHDFTIYDRDDVPRLRIGTMEAWMRSMRSLADSESQFEVRLTYGGISVDGSELEPLIDISLCSAPTFAAVTTALPAPAGTLTATGTLVRGFHPPGAVVLSTAGCELAVPSVGRAVFGEFEFKQDYRRVRLLRVKLNSGGVVELTNSGARTATVGGDDGYIVAGAVEGNGSPPF